MSSGTLLFLLLVVGVPLAMMLMHRGGHGDHGGMGGMGGGCGMGHVGRTAHGDDHASRDHANHTPTSGNRGRTEDHATQSGTAHQADGEGHQRHRC